jgi:hypothetical protein
MTITYPLTMPSSPGFKASGWDMFDVVGATMSDFSLASQKHEFSGKRLGPVEIELPKMRPAQAGAWAAFFARLKGRRGTFLLPAPAGLVGLGAGGGTPVVAGSHSARAEVLNVRDLPDAANIWLAGQWIQIGSGSTARLHMVTADVSGNVGSPSGQAAVDIWPSLRTTLADGDPITVTSPKGLFELVDNRRHFDVEAARNYGFSFTCQEAL